jgi:hypothetical protein
MTLEDINYVAQTIGVLAILASLVFVGIQVRQNTEQARRAHLLAVSDKGMQHQDRIIALWQIAMNDARLAVPITQGQRRHRRRGRCGYSRPARRVVGRLHVCSALLVRGLSKRPDP